MTTVDLDTSNVKFLQFTMNMGCSKAGGYYSTATDKDDIGDILIQFSYNAGINYHTLKVTNTYTKVSI